MVDLVERAIQVDVNNNREISDFFQHLQHIIRKYVTNVE